jgi:hypothetical protein
MTEPAREGAITVTFLNAANDPVLATEIEELADQADEFLARYLVGMICEVGTAGATISIFRAEGKPTAADRLLWELVEPLADDQPVILVGFSVAGAERIWSFRDAAAA